MKKFMIAICCAVAFSGCTCEEKKEPASEPEAKPVPAVTKVTPKNLKFNTKQLQLSLEALQKYKEELAEKQAQGEAALQAGGTEAKSSEGNDASSPKAAEAGAKSPEEKAQADKADQGAGKEK